MTNSIGVHSFPVAGNIWLLDARARSAYFYIELSADTCTNLGAIICTDPTRVGHVLYVRYFTLYYTWYCTV